MTGAGAGSGFVLVLAPFWSVVMEWVMCLLRLS